MWMNGSFVLLWCKKALFLPVRKLLIAPCFINRLFFGKILAHSKLHNLGFVHSLSNPVLTTFFAHLGLFVDKIGDYFWYICLSRRFAKKTKTVFLKLQIFC